MDFVDFIAGNDDQGRRLDKVIRKMSKDSNISSLYSAIRKGLIKVNGKKADINVKIQLNDKISIAKFLLENQSIQVSKPNENHETKDTLPEFSEIFSNPYVRIINKPYNVNVHGPSSLSDAVIKVYNSEPHDSSLSFVPGPLHRLDKKTTGLITFSNSLKGAEWFSKNIQEKNIRKIYLGICEGTVTEKELYSDYIVDNSTGENNFYTMKIDNNNQLEKNLAQTVITPLANGTYKTRPVTLCQFEILTGKKHQIRCQSSFHHNPLLGDTAYGGTKITSAQDFYLHAYKMIFPKDNPIELPESITAEIPENFTKFLKVSLIKWDGKIII